MVQNSVPGGGRKKAGKKASFVFLHQNCTLPTVNRVLSPRILNNSQPKNTFIRRAGARGPVEIPPPAGANSRFREEILPLRANYNVKSLGKSVEIKEFPGIRVSGRIRGIRGKSENWGEFEEFGGNFKLSAESLSPRFLTNHMSWDKHRLALDHCAGILSPQ